MLDKVLVVAGIAIALVVGAVIFTQLVPISNDLGNCPAINTNDPPLVKSLKQACDVLVKFGGAIIIIAILIGLVVYIRFFSA